MSGTEPDRESPPQIDENPPDIVERTPLQERAAALEEIFRETVKEEEALRERTELAQRLGFGGKVRRIDDTETPGVEEKEEEEEEQSTTMSTSGQTTSTTLPTVHGSAGDMFLDAGPCDKSELKNGTCSNPLSKRGTTEKDIAKTKLHVCVALELQFESPYYYVSGKYDVDGNKKALHKSACDAIISCTFTCKKRVFGCGNLTWQMPY